MISINTHFSLLFLPIIPTERRTIEALNVCALTVGVHGQPNQYRVHLRLPHLKQERAVGRHEKGDLPHLLFLAPLASLNCADGCNFGAVFEFLLREIEVPHPSKL